MQANYAGEPIKEHDDKLTAAEIQQAEAEAAGTPGEIAPESKTRKVGKI